MSANHRLGALGEEIALRYLESCGYRLLDRHFRRPGGEIDLILLRGDLVVFVEVKTRGPRSPAPAAYWLTPWQLSRLRRMARRWLSERGPRSSRGCRFDLVAIDHQGEEEGLTLRHMAGIT